MVDSANYTHITTKANTQPQNSYNPFEPTTRDYKRTEELAAKNLAAVIIGGLFISPIAASLYLGRAANLFKILVYTFISTMTICVTVFPNEAEAAQISRGMGSVANLVILAEQVNAVKQAKKRQSEEN